MLVVYLMLTGLVIGALGRFALPGPNPMSVWVTILVGIGGAVAGGLIVWALGLSDNLGFVISVLCATAIVYLVNGRGTLRRRDHL